MRRTSKRRCVSSHPSQNGGRSYIVETIFSGMLLCSLRDKSTTFLNVEFVEKVLRKREAVDAR